MTAISSCIVVVLVCFVIHFLLYPKIYQGVQVEGVDLSGYSQEEAAKLLIAWQEERQRQVITFSFGENQFQLKGTSIDFSMDIQKSLLAAWSYGRDGSWWQRIKKIKDAKQQGYQIPVDIRYNEAKLTALIEEWQSHIERPARNATISMATGKIAKEQQGYCLEVDELRTLILESLLKSEDRVKNFPIAIRYPRVTADKLESANIHEVLSRYTTTFNPQDNNRGVNIKLAAEQVNGHILYPGETFSFNDIVGPREKSYGFKEAMEIVDGEFVPGVGGGICQLSSTLYNAVMLANLDTVERYNHSKALSYVPLGRDATVVFDILDFKFVNNTLKPLMIMAEVNDDQLTVAIWGQQSLVEKVEIVTKKQEQILPIIHKKQDDELYIGETKLEKKGKPGTRITVVRVVRLKGRKIKEEILSKDCYPAEDGLLKIGTKIPPFS